MYPLHKYLPTPFGTYLLYIDNGPTRIRVNKDRPQLPTYQAVKDYGRQQRQNFSKYQAYPKPMAASATAPGMARHSHHPKVPKTERKQQSYTPSSTMPNSIWSPKVKRMHLSYNMRQLWHTGQPVKDGPSKVVEVDEVTGAELVAEAQWHKYRSSKEHEGIMGSPGYHNVSREDSKRRSNSSMHSDDTRRPMSWAQEEEQKNYSRSQEAEFGKSGKSRSKVPPNTAARSPALSEAYKRQASHLRHDMVPRRQKKPKRLSSHQQRRDGDDELYHCHLNKETQTSPVRSRMPSMNYAAENMAHEIAAPAAIQRSSSVPIKASAGDYRLRDCVEKTGLPPIIEAEAPAAVREGKPLPKTVTVETDTWRQRVRRVQDFRSASPTFPIRSKGEFWEEISKGRVPNAKSHGLLPFAWKEPARYHQNVEKSKQQRAIEVEKILPAITRMPSVPRV